MENWKNKKDYKSIADETIELNKEVWGRLPLSDEQRKEIITSFIIQFDGRECDNEKYEQYKHGVDEDK